MRKTTITKVMIKGTPYFDYKLNEITDKGKYKKYHSIRYSLLELIDIKAQCERELSPLRR